jgi:UDP-N-acetylmuramate dehydrogenase
MQMEFDENVPLAPYTTLRVGGPARWFAEAASEPDVAMAVAFARDRRLPLFVLGGGSNLLVSDGGFPGLVLRVGLRGIDATGEGHLGGKAAYSVGAGEPWDAFVAYAVERKQAGLECLSGIPGLAGGTPVQNVGAYGQEVSQTIHQVRAYDRRALAYVLLSNAECGFAYRSSIFNTTERDRYIVTRVEYLLTPDGAPTVSYQDLKLYFKDSEATLSTVRQAVLEIRARKGMVISQGDRDSLSAGSFFKNPVEPSATLSRIAAALQLPEESVPHYPAGKTHMKLMAAWLIEQAGFRKGYRLGAAAISSRHTLAIVNCGEARARDIIALRDQIVEAVDRRFGIRLQPEPVWVGGPLPPPERI